MSKFFSYLFLTFIGLVMIGLLGLMCFFGVQELRDWATTEVVETYIVGAEVSHSDYASYYQKNHGVVTRYVLGVRNDDFSTVFSVDASIWAKYAVGDIVEVEVREMESHVNTWTEYKLLG